MARSRILWMLLVLSLSACGSGEQNVSGSGGPRLELLDSIRLDESSDGALGLPRYVEIDPWDGSFYVSDAFRGRVVRFSRDGRFMRAYGSTAGPDRIGRVGHTFALNDSLLAIQDEQGPSLRFFDRNSAALRGRRNFRGIPNQVQVVGDTVWMGDEDPDRGTSLLRWDVLSDSMSYLGPLPREYQQAPGYGHVYPRVSFAAWGDTVLVGHGGRNELFLETSEGRVLDTIAVPVVHRRGVPQDMVQRFGRRTSMRELVGSLSTVYGVHRLPDGKFAIVHADITMHGTSKTALMTAALYLTVLSRDRRLACVDGVPETAAPEGWRATLRGDTLFLMQRRVDSGGDAETWIKRYHIDDHQCRWIPAT